MTDLHDIGAVQKRPGMYVGPTDDGTGVHNMVYEVVGNAINEALAGHATRITVRLNRDGSCTVQDDGRGLATDIHPGLGISIAEAAMTKLHAGLGEYPPNGYVGVGLCVVNALSQRLELRIWRDGMEHQMRFSAGEIDTPLRGVGDANTRRGTEITFLPSPKFFTETAFTAARIDIRLRELASQYGVPIHFSSIE